MAIVTQPWLLVLALTVGGPQITVDSCVGRIVSYHVFRVLVKGCGLYRDNSDVDDTICLITGH